jgi:hypothetical protein
MVKLADMEFLNAVEAVPARKGSMVEKHEQRMLQAVLHGRKDLRSQAKSKQGSKS